ncbi:MAG: hypothetical protein KKA07_16920 [Bacteroidetes bacterium]|nr:hypothetical protein [Bacteroidota bacterium]
MDTDKELRWEDLPKAAREFTSFLDLIIDSIMEDHLPEWFVSTEIRCHKKRCHGTIYAKYSEIEDAIHWRCNTCKTSGVITNMGLNM